MMEVALMSKSWLRNNFELLKEDGDWAMYINHPVYKEITAYGNYYIINTETGEDCGQQVLLYCRLFDNEGNKLDKPIYDKNCYEIRERLND